MNNEKFLTPSSGYLMLFISLILIAIARIGMAIFEQYWMIVFAITGIFLLPGFIIVNPNESSVLVLFGKYKGTIVENGFFWINPFFMR